MAGEFVSKGHRASVRGDGEVLEVMVATAHSNSNALKASVLYTQKWVKHAKFLLWLFHHNS